MTALSLALAAAGRVPALAMALAAAMQAVPAPTLLVGHLRVADLECLDAAAYLPPEGATTPDGSARWASERLARAAQNLSAARRSTVDPAEQDRLARLANEADQVRETLKARSEGVALRVTRLRSEIRRFAGEIQRRIDLRQADPVPLTRPALGP